MSEKQNTFLKVADAIKSEKRAWCKGDWSETDESGTKVISRCLVDHIDAITGVYKVVGYKKVTRPPSEDEVSFDRSYMEPIVRKSTDKRRWAKRDKLLAQLAALLPGRSEENYFYMGKLNNGTPDSMVTSKTAGRYVTEAADDLVTFNDSHSTTRADVLKLLRRAAATYPNAWVSDDFKIQVSYKLGPNSQDMINVRALNGHELNALLEELGAIASSVQSTGDLVRGVAAVTTTFPAAQVVHPPAQPAQLPANVVQMPNPAAAFQQPPTPAMTPGADQAPRFCAHGQRVRKEGTTNGRKWVAYFCTLPKGSAGACEAEWVR